MRIDDLFDVGGSGGPEVVSQRIWTLPNALSFVRLAVMPLVFVDILAGRHVRALVVLALLAATDWVDGYVARRFDQVTALGKLLDPVSDRILIVLVVLAIGITGIAPWWALAVVLARDVVVAIAALVMARRGRRPPAVSRVGKTATFGLMTVFPTLLLAEALGPPARGPLRVVCFVSLAIATALYWWAALGYARVVARSAPAAADRESA